MAEGVDNDGVNGAEVLEFPDAQRGITVNSTAKNAITTALDDTIQLELDILNAIQSRLNQVQGVWSSSYLPCELATLAEVCTTPKLTIDIPTVAGIAMGETAKGYAIASESIRADMRAMCFTDSCGVDGRLAVTKARSESWKVQGALRYEESRIQMENAVRLNNKMTMIAPGRNGVVAAATSMAAAAKIYAEMSTQAAAAKNSDRYAQGQIITRLGGVAKSIGSLFAPSPAQADATMRLNQETFRASEITAQNLGTGDSPNPYASDITQYSTGEYTNTFAGDAAAYSAPASVDAPTVSIDIAP